VSASAAATAVAAGGDGDEQKNVDDDGHLSPSPSLSIGVSLSYEDYEPCDEEDEHWPIWGMTGEDPWKDRVGEENGGTLSVAECERIFTVPEVYEEIQRRRPMQKVSSLIFRSDDDSNEVGPCRGILNCFNPWKQPTRAAIEDWDALTPSAPATHSSADNDFLDSADALESREHHPGRDRECRNIRGVVKRSSMAVQLYLGMPTSARQSFTPSMYKVLLEDEAGGGRPSIIGNDHRQVYAMGMNVDGSADVNADAARDGGVAKKKRHPVYFSELKRVLRVRKFTPEEAFDVWFQREDFDFFRNEMSLLIQEEIASQELAQTWLDAQNRRNNQMSVTSITEGGGRKEDEERRPVSTGAKAWWHDYDHSRRGLEKYASTGQARQILASYRVAVQKVLQEQERQSLLGFFCVPGARDPERIAEVYHEYTAWSRDLALAAAASDADAVRTDFDDDKRHTREFYMLKQIVASGYKVHKHMPQFMMPKCIIPKGFLDEAETLFDDKRGKNERDEASRGRPSLLKPRDLTGQEARDEMSRLHSKDLEGPVPPALAVRLQVNKEKAAVSPKPPLKGLKQKSLAEKAKNYPF